MFSSIFISLIAIIFQSFWIINIIPSLVFYEIDFNTILISTFILIISIWIYYLVMLNEFSDLVDSLFLSLIIIILCIFWIYFPDIEFKKLVSINALIWSLIFFLFFYIQYIIWIILHQIEKRTKKEKDYKFQDWIIGWWDLRIAILVWLLLWFSLSPAWLMLTYLCWSIISIFILIFQKYKNKTWKLNTQVPFWPFIAIGFFITIFFQEQINNLLKIYFF
jgi:hypothetical protein